MLKIFRFIASTLLIATITGGCTLATTPQTERQQNPELVIAAETIPSLEKKDPEDTRLPKSIDPAEFVRLVAIDAIQVIDVREPEEFAKGHIQGAINIFDEDFIFKAQETIAKLDTKRRVVLVCTTGARSGSSYYAILAATPGFANQDQLQYLDAEVTYAADGSFEIGK